MPTRSRRQVAAQRRQFLRVVVSLATVVLWLGQPAWAANQTWNGSTGNGNWDAVGNWVGGTGFPGSTSVKTSTDTATFNGTESASNVTVTIDSATQNIGSIVFTTTNAKSDTIGSLGANGGNTLFLTSGGSISIDATVTQAILETINSPLKLEGAYSFLDNSTNAATSLTFNGNVALDASAAASTLTVGGANGVTLNGIISNGGNTLALTKTGADTLILTGANTYTGINTLSAGVVSLGAAESVGVSGPLGKSAAVNAGNIVLGGATLQYTPANQFDYSGRFSTAASQKYNVDINGQNITWAANLSSAGGALILSSTVGGGTLNLTGNNVFLGATAGTGVTINNGTLQVGSAGALNSTNPQAVTLANNGVLALNGFSIAVKDLTSASATSVIENSNTSGVANAILTVNENTATTNFSGIVQDGFSGGTLGITKNGTLNLVLGNAANSFTGPTVVNGGVLHYLVAGAQGNTSGITLNAGGTITEGASGTAGSGGVIPLATLASLITPASTGTLGIGFNNPDSETVNLSAPVFLGAGSGNFSTFNGTINAVGGSYRFGGGGVGQLYVNTSGTGGILSGSNGVIIQGILKSANGSAGASTSLWNTLSNAGAGGSGGGAATITAGGTIGLQGQNTYTGDTQVNVATSDATQFLQAILQVNNSSLVSGGALVSGPIGVGNLHISGGGLQDGGLPVVLNNNVAIDGNAIFSSQGNGTLTFNSVGLTTPATFSIANNPSLIVKNIATTISDNITGNSNLTTAGIGNLILDGNNTFTGNITINPATVAVATNNGYAAATFNIGFGGVQFNSPSAIGNGANVITVNAGAYAAAGPSYNNLQTTFFNRIATASSGTIALTASTADSFDWSATGANLTAAGLGAAYGSSVTYSGTLTPNGTTYRLGGGGGSLNVSSLLSGAGNSLSAFGSNMSGTLILSGANTYGGGTTISGTNLASYFNPGVGNNANPGESRSQVQLAGNSSMASGAITNGPLGTGTITFVGAPAIEDNGTNILVANNVIASSASNFNTAFTSSPIGFNSAGNGSLTFDGGPGSSFNLATLAVGDSLLVNNFTTIRTPITGTQTFSAGNQFFTISGTGTLVLADQGTWNYSAANNLQSANNSTLLLAGTTLRFGASSIVTAGAIASGPLGKGTLSINGAGNVGSFLQDNGTNITIANPVFMNLGNPVKFDSTGAGSITFDGTSLSTPATISIAGTSTLTLTPDSTVIINDKITGNAGTTAAILNIGTISGTPQGGDAYPYGTVVLNSNGSTFSGGTNLNYATLVVGSSTVVTSGALTSGPVGTGRLTINNNFPIFEDNGSNITLANNITIGNSFLMQSLGNGSITFDGTNLTTKSTVTINGTNNQVVNGTLIIKDQVTGAQNLVMAGTGKIELNNASGTNSTFNAIAANNGLVQVDTTGSFGNGTNSNVATNPNNFKAIINFGGTLAAGPSMTSLQSNFFNNIAGKWSAGTAAITANSSDNYDFSAAGDNVVQASLGAVGGSLAAPIVYSGTLTPNGTTYRLGGGGGFLQMSQALVNGDSLIVGGGGSGGTVILASATPYTGAKYVNLGTLQLNTAPGSGSITLAPGGAIAGNFASLSTNLLPLIASNSTGVVALSGNSSENLDLTATPNVGLGAQPVAGGVAYTGTLAPVAGSYNVGGGGGTLTMSNVLGDVGGPTSLVAFGGGSGGTLILNSANTFSGGVTVLPGTTITPYFSGAQQAAIIASGNAPAAGILRVTGSSAAGNTSGPVGTGTLRLAGGILDNGTASTVTLLNSVNLLASTSLTSSGGGSLTFSSSGGTTFNVANGSMLTVNVPTTINDSVTGSTGFTKTGTATLVLGGASSYSGPTNILNGIVQMGPSGVLPSGTTVNIGLGGYVYTGSLTKTPGTLDLNGTSQSVDGLAGTGIVTNSGGSASTLTIGGNGGSSQFFGTIQNGASTVAIVKSGAGVVALSSANTYSGGTTVSGGTLRLAPAGTGVLQMGGAGTTLTNASGSTTILSGPVGTGTLTLTTGATLQDSGYATNLANAISASGNLTFSSPSLSSTFGSPGSGSLVFDGTALATPSTFNLTGSTTLTVNNTTTVADSITQSGGNWALTKNGSGTLILSGSSNSYGGGTTVNAGILQVNSALNPGVLINNAGTLAAGPGIGAGDPSTPLAAMLAGFGITTNSTGTLALTGNDSENVSFAGWSTLSLGAVGNVTYSGTLTPNGTTYMLGGGGGTLTVTSALSSSNSLVVGGNTAGGGSGGTVILTSPLNSATTVNSGVLQLTTVGSGNITVNSGGTVAAAGTYAATSATPITSSLLPLISAGSQGTLALTGNSSENLNLASYPNLSLGAAAGANASYSGTLTPAGTTYRLGGGGGTLTMNSALSGAGNRLVVNGSGSGGTVALGGTGNSYGGGTTVVKGTLAVGPNPGVLGSGTVTLNSGSTLTLLPYSAPLAASGWNYDVIAGLGEASAQSGATASFGDNGYALYQHGLPGSQQVGNLGLPASRSMVGFANNDTVFHLQPYNQNNALKLGIGNANANAQSYSPQGTLVLKNPGQYQALSILDGAPFGATFFEVQLNFADGTSVLVPNSAGSLPNYYAGDWAATQTAFNVNTANYQLGFMGAGSVTIVPNNGSFQAGAPAGLWQNMAAAHPILYENDVQIPAALQSKTLTSVTVIDTGAFNGSNNSVDYLHATNQLNIMALSGTLIGATQGATSFSNSISVPAGGSSTIDMQNAQGISFSGNLSLGDGSTLNVTNSTGAVSTGAVGGAGVQPFTLWLGQSGVQLPTSGSRTVTFNVAGPGELLSVSQAQAPVTLKLGALDDGGGPATINITGGGSVVLASTFALNLNSPQFNISGGSSLVAQSGGVGSTGKVNVAAGSSFATTGFVTVSQLTGPGNVLLNSTANLTIGSTDNLNNAVSAQFAGDGTVQNGGSNNTLTLNGGSFANTSVVSNGSSTLPAIVAGNTMALGNTASLSSGGVLRLAATPGTATLSGFGNNYGVPDQNGFGGAGVVSNGWTINSNGFIANGATGNSVIANNNVPSGTPYTAFPSPNVLHLTNGGAGETRTAFYNTPVAYANGAAGFTTSFTYTPGMQAQADGMTFILQNDPWGAGALGGTGVRFGSTNLNTVNVGQGAYKGYGGIANSVAIELDMFQNGSPGGVGTALAINGSNTPISLPVKWLADGDPINVSISYSPTAQTLTETLVDTLVPANVFSTVYTGVNLSSILGKPTAYVGFGGASGGQFVDQTISNFKYTLAGVTPGSYATNIALNGNSTIDLMATSTTPTFSTTGGLNSNGGTLTLSATTAASNLNYGMTFNGPSSLGGSVTINALNAGSGGSGVGTVTFASRVSGPGSITNMGPGNVVLSALNTFTGGLTTTAATTVASVPGSLSSGTVTLGGGILKLSTSQPYSAPVVLSTPIAATGWNQDVIVAANQVPATVFPTLTGLDGAGISAPNSVTGSQVFYQTGAAGSPPGTGLPANGVIGDVTTPNAFNSNVTFQLQPYSTPNGGLVNNVLQLNNTNVTGTLSLTTPGKYSSLSILHMTGSGTNGEGSFEMQLNFTDAPPLMVGSGGGSNSPSAGPGILSPDWFNNAGSVFPSLGVGRYGGGTNFNGAPGNPRMYEYDYTVPLAYQNATLESVTFDYGLGGKVNIFGISGTPLTTSNLNAVNVTADSTIDVTGTATSGLTGLTTIGSNTLHVTGGSTGANAAYTLSLGTTGGVQLSGNPVFDVANNGSGTGTLLLGSLNDQGSSRTLEFSGAGATTLGTAATSLIANTAVTIDAGATLNSNAAGTATSGGSLGQFAQISIGNNGTFRAGASQTISSLSGSGKVTIDDGKTLGIGNSDSLTTVYAGQIVDPNGAHGSINVGVPGSTGSLTLTNSNNTYHGTTTVSGGTLVLQTAGTNNIPNSSAINVLGGSTLDVTGVTGGFTLTSGQTLQGASILGGAGGGTVNGKVAVGSGAIIAGTSTTPGSSLTISVAGAGPALTLQNGSSSSFTLQGSLASTTPLIATSSGSGQSLNLTGADTVNISANSLLPTSDSTFRLFSYTGSQLTTGQFSNFSLGSSPASFTLQYSYALSNQPGHVDLIVTPLGLNWAGVDDPAGAAAPVDNNWTTSASNNNWVNSSNASTQFTAGSQVIFADTYPTAGGPVAVPTPQNIVIQAGGVSTTGVTFGPSSVLYTFSNAAGTVGIAGTGGLAFLGTSAAPVTFDSANSFSGPVVISSGQLNLGDGVSVNNGNALGAATGSPLVGAGAGVTVSPGATLNLNSVSGSSVAFGNGWGGAAPTGATISLALGGTGSGAAGMLGALNSQSGKNSYAGPISIESSGATIASTSIVNGDGLTLSGGINNTTNAGAAAATLTFAGAGDTTVNSAISDASSANALSIALAGPGNLILSGSNSYHGSTALAGGMLILKSANSLGNSSGVTVPAMAGLVLSNSATGNRADASGAIPLSLSGTGTSTTIPGTAFIDTGALTATGGNSTYAGPISLPADATVATTAASDVLNLTGSVTIGTGSSSQALTFVGPGAVNLSGTIANANATQIGSLVVSTTANATAGTVALSGNNTYSGGTTVNSGALVLQGPKTLGNTSSVTVSAGAALVLQNNATYGSTVNNPTAIPLVLTGAGTGVGSAANGANGALTGVGTVGNTYTGPITIMPTMSSTGATIATSAAGDILTLSGAINSTGATTTLTGPATINITGGLNITTGGGAAGLVVATGGTGTFTVSNKPIIDGATGGTVAMSGTGTLNLNTANAYTGGTTVGGGAAANTGLVVAGSTFALGSGAATLNGGILRLTTNVPSVSGFGGSGTGWTVNSTNITSNAFPASNVLQLTDSANNEARTAFFNSVEPIGAGFTASWTYTPSAGSATRADGAAFVIQAAPAGAAALGGGGGNLGYGGITPSSALEMNIFNGHTIGTNFVNNGATGTYNATGAINFNSGDPIKVTLAYDPTTTTVTETDTDQTTHATFSTTYSDDIAANLGSSIGFIGFSGATGGSNATQQISNFTFLAGPTAPTYANALVMNAGQTSTIQVVATATAPTIVAGNLTVNSGAASTLNIAANGAPANQAYGLTLGSVTLNGNPTFNVANNGTGLGTLTLGPLNDGGTARAITINGAGTVLLNAAATGMVTGSSINVGGAVTNGNLVVTNAVGSPTGSAAVNVNNGGTLAGTFTGSGSIAGQVTVTSGGTILGSNAAALAGTPLVISGGLNLATGSNSSFALTATPNVSTPPTTNKGMIVANGGLTVTGTDTVLLTGAAPSSFTLGQPFTYDLFDYTGTLTSTQNGSGLSFSGGGSMAIGSLANLTSSGAYSFQLVNNTTLSQIDIVLTPAPLTWTGATNGAWDINTTTNWANTSLAATKYVDGAAVVFANKNPITNNTITNTTVTIVAGGVLPGLVSFANTGPGNSGVNYVIQNAAGGNKGIGGATPVTISGAGGQVTFAGANSFTGPLSITAGQLNLSDVETINGVNYSLGLGNASSVSVSAGATLLLQGTTGAARIFGQGYNGSAGLAVASLTSPIGLTINGTGQSGGALNSAAGNNTYVGLISIGGGGATIASTGVPASADALTLSGGLNIAGGATVTFTGAGTTNVATIADGGNGGSAGSVAVSGTGMVNFTTANSYYGATSVNSGSLILSNATAMGNSSAAIVGPGGTLAITGGTVGTPFTYGNRAVDNSPISLTLNGAGATSGTFANTGALASAGVNTYAGPTSVSSSSTIATTAAADTLTLTGGIGIVGGTAGSPTVLTIAGPGTTTVPSVISDGAGTGGSGVGKLVINSGNVNLPVGTTNNVFNNYTGGTTINTSGTVVVPSSGSLSSGLLTLNNNNGILRVVPTGAPGPNVSTFGGNGTGWTQNGTNAGTFINSDVLELTVNPGGANRSAWYNTPVTYQTAGANVGFTAKFTYQFQGGTNPPADGITFTLQNAAAGTSALGGGGGSFGYAGITPSAAIQLNIYTGANGGQGTAFNVNGGIGNNTAFGAPNTNNLPTSPVQLASTTGTPAGDPINVTVYYNPVSQTITETLVDSIGGATYTHTYTGVNLASVLGNNGSAIVGFTGATGGSLSTQDITNFSFTNGNLPTTYPSTVLNSGISSTIDVSGAFAGGPAATFGTLSIASGGAATLNITDATDTAGAAYGATFGATTLNSNVTFNVANAALGANGTGTLTLGAIGEAGSHSVTKTGPGTLVVGATGTYSGGTIVTNGTATATADNALGTGSLEVDTAGGNISAVNLQANQTVTALTGTVSGAGTARVNVSAGKTLTINQPSGTSTFAGNIALASGATPGSGGTLSKSGGGTQVLSGVPALGNNSSLGVSGGTLKIAATTGTPNVGSGVTAAITSTGTLELAGSVSALGTTVAANRTNISNTSTAAAGLLVSAGSHQVGGVDGSGVTQVNTGASLTVNHIVQGALVIGGSSTTLAALTIDASDTSGNSLVAAGGLGVTDAVAAVPPMTVGSSGLTAGGTSSLGASSSLGSTAQAPLGSVAIGGTAAVPEPSTLLLTLCGLLAAATALRRKRNSSRG